MRNGASDSEKAYLPPVGEMKKEGKVKEFEPMRAVLGAVQPYYPGKTRDAIASGIARKN
jgi:hypothetical protein